MLRIRLTYKKNNDNNMNKTSKTIICTVKMKSTILGYID